MNHTKERPTRAAQRRRATRQRTALAALLAVVVIVTFTLVLCTSANESGNAAPPEDAALPSATETIPLSQQEEREPVEQTTVEPTASASPVYLSDTIPLSYELQEIMWAECERWGCPYALALAVAEVESEFNMEAVGAVGEVGIMQLNPGPGGSYHAELEAATGLDPTTPKGNISGGVYLLGKYMKLYGDPAKAAMAYSMGHYGAQEAWAAGIITSAHAEKVLAALERWEAVLGE